MAAVLSIWHQHCHVKLSVPGFLSHLAVLENRERLCRAGRSGSHECGQIPLQICHSGKGLYKDREVFWEYSHSHGLPVSRAKCVGSQAVPPLNPSLLSQAGKIEGHNGGISDRRFAITSSPVLCHE